MTRSLLLLALLIAAPASAQINGPAFCIDGSASLGGRTYACSGVDLMAVVPRGPLGIPSANQVNDIWGWADPETGREYALVGADNATAFVDVTAPTTPVVLGRMLTQSGSTIWRDIKTYQNHAFVVSEAGNHGVQVFDLTRLRGLTPDRARTFAPDAVYTGMGSAHNIAINEATGFAYAVGSGGGTESCQTGLHMIDVRTPTAPTYAGCYDGDGYTHDAQCVLYDGPDADYSGREICFAYNADTVTVVDVTDKAAPVMLSRAFYPSPGYVHQGWLTEDSRYAIVDDESNDRATGTRTIVMDAADLDDVSFAFFHFGTESTVAHNQYVLNGRSYQSNYNSGLRILDLGGIAGGTITEAGFFDTPDQWSNYPYLPSGTIIASDISGGLFVLDALPITIAAEPPNAEATRFTLSAPVPNPTGGDARLTLSVPTPQRVRAVLVDALGREVQTLFDGRVEDAREIAVRSAGLPAGTYVVRARGEREAATRTVAVVR